MFWVITQRNVTNFPGVKRADHSGGKCSTIQDMCQEEICK